MARRARCAGTYTAAATEGSFKLGMHKWHCIFLFGWLVGSEVGVSEIMYIGSTGEYSAAQVVILR